MNNFKELKIWMKSKDLCLEIYQITKGFPKEELYGITNQLRRAAVSVPANISEGAGRYHKNDFAHFINISLGSLNEIYTFVEISKELNYVNQSIVENLTLKIEELRKMLYTFNKSLRS
jgi:four helix bundle protein